MMSDIVERLRDHERHAVHDQDDDCAEAADAIEGLARDLHETRLLADRLTRELEQWKDAADEQAGPIQALLDERNELLAEVVKLRALVRVLQADGPDPLGGRMDV